MPVYLIRHAESEGNRLRRLAFLKDSLSGDPLGSHLSETGKQQAQALAQELMAVAFTRIYSSNLNRALETAQPLARARQLPIFEVEQIKERVLGEEDYLAGQRLKSWLVSVLLENSGTTAVVSHGAVMRALLADLGLAAVEELSHGTIDNTGYAVLEPTSDSFKVIFSRGIHPRSSSGQ